MRWIRTRRRVLVAERAGSAGTAADVVRVATTDARERVRAAVAAAGRDPDAVAVLLEAHPDWTPAQVKGALMATLEDRINERDRFLAILGHDLRSPLVNLQGFSRELEKGCRRLAALLPPDGNEGNN